MIFVSTKYGTILVLKQFLFLIPLMHFNITTLFKLTMRLSRFILMAVMSDSDQGSYKSQLDSDEKPNRDKRIPRAALTRYKYCFF